MRFVWLAYFFCMLISAQVQAIEIEKTMNEHMESAKGIQYVKLDNGFRVWTKRVGQGPIKILLLHGGPGFTHECFECFENFFPKDQFQLIYYDQLGSHYSDQPDDPSLWNIERFCQEVEQVRQALGLEGFYLYGYSWGSMLGIEYSLKYPSYLKGLILSNMTASIASYEAYLNELKSQISLTTLDQNEKMMSEQMYRRHICRIDPWPEPVLRTMHHFNKKVCDAVFGPNESATTGNCKEWNRWNDLAKIEVPTLVIGGRFDTINPQDLERMGSLIPKSQVKICENGSHLSMYDDQGAYFQALLSFLTDVDKTY